jgi:hypothetical protein
MSNVSNYTSLISAKERSDISGVKVLFDVKFCLDCTTARPTDRFYRKIVWQRLAPDGGTMRTTRPTVVKYYGCLKMSSQLMKKLL